MVNSPDDCPLQMKALLFLKLPHPAPSRPQAQRRQELLKEAVTLIKLLSSSGASPSNMKAAVAAAADGGPFTSAAVAADAVRKTAYTGLMHGMKGDQQMKAYWELRHCLEALLKSLRQEVSPAATTCVIPGMPYVVTRWS